MLLAPQQNLISQRHWRSNDTFSQIVLREHTEAILFDPTNENHAIFPGGKHLACSHQRRRVKVRTALGELPLPDRLSRRRIDPLHRPKIPDQHHLMAIKGWGWDKGSDILPLPDMTG